MSGPREPDGEHEGEANTWQYLSNDFAWVQLDAQMGQREVGGR